MLRFQTVLRLLALPLLNGLNAAGTLVALQRSQGPGLYAGLGTESRQILHYRKSASAASFATKPTELLSISLADETGLSPRKI